MLGIDFLKAPTAITVAGLEFMDYQDSKFYQDLVKVISEVIVDKDGVYTLDTDRKTATAIQDMVMERTGIKLNVRSPEESVSNLAIDAGFFIPNGLINIKNIEAILSSDNSSIGTTFRKLNTDVLRGYVDTSKARIGGDFSKVEFTLYTGKFISSFISRGFLEKHKVTVGEALAGFIIHELGHIFTGFLYLTRTVIDSIMPVAAAKLITNKDLYGKERVAVVHEALKDLECPERPDASTLDKLEPEEMILMFSKYIANRDMRRTLSIGAGDRVSEVIADMYVIKMGCSKNLVIALAALHEQSTNFNLKAVAIVGALAAAMGFLTPILIAFGGAIFIYTTAYQISKFLLPNSLYDSNYRRLKNLLRESINMLNDTKGIDNRAKAQMLKDIREMEKVIDEAKPFFEGTAVQRVVGWIMSGSDFKAQDLEHYTDELLAHTLSTYKETF